jgi:hypothetical protein
MTMDFLERVLTPLRKKPILSLSFLIAYVILVVFWRRNLPAWKVYPFLLVVLITFLFLISVERKSLTIRYCKISLVIFLFSLIGSVILVQLTETTLPMKILYLIALNLKLSVFIIFLKDIIFANAIRYIVNRKWYRIIAVGVLLWVYISWMFAIAYSHPSVGCVCTQEESFDPVTSINTWYFSISTITTAGYGDFYPTGICRIIAAVEMLLGFFLISIMAGLVAGAAYEEIKRMGE